MFDEVLFMLLCISLEDKRIHRQYGYIARGTPPIVQDCSYSRWALHYSIISAISSEGLLAMWVLKNPEERFNALSFIHFLDHCLHPSMNSFDGENSRSVLVMGKTSITY